MLMYLTDNFSRERQFTLFYVLVKFIRLLGDFGLFKQQGRLRCRTGESVHLEVSGIKAGRLEIESGFDRNKGLNLRLRKTNLFVFSECLYLSQISSKMATV